MTIRVVSDKAWRAFSASRNWPGGVFPFSSWACADDPHVVVYAGSEVDTYADPADPASPPMATCPRCHQPMPGYADALAAWGADFSPPALAVASMDAETLADAGERGLYGHDAEGREWVYSTGHNGLVFTGRVADKARELLYVVSSHD